MGWVAGFQDTTALSMHTSLLGSHPKWVRTKRFSWEVRGAQRTGEGVGHASVTAG